MNLKRSVLLSMAMLLCGALLFAGGQKSTAPASTGGGELKGEISFATWGDAGEKAVNEAVIKAFEAKYPGTKVNLVYMPDFNEYNTRIDTMFVGNSAPDVVYGLPHMLYTWFTQGMLKDLTAEYDKDKAFYSNPDFTQSAYDAFKLNGKPFGTINGSDTNLLFYNKTMFDAAGVSYPGDTWTWNDVLEAAKKLTNDKQGAEKKYGIVFTGSFGSTIPIIYSFGGRIFDDMNNPKKVVINSPETIAAFKFIKDAIYTYKVAPPYAAVSGTGFDTGNVAMSIDGMWMPANYRSITAFKWDMANMPLPPNGGKRATGIHFAGYGVNAKSKNPALAYAYAKFYMEDEGQKLLAAPGLITVVNERIASAPELLKGPGLPEHNYLRVSSSSYAINEYANMITMNEVSGKVLEPAFSALITTDITPEACAKQIQDQLQEILNRR